MIKTRFVYTLLVGILFTVQVRPADSRNGAGFAEDYALIIGGVGGEKSFYDEFWRATSRMHELLTKEYGNSPKNITFLFEDEGTTPGLVSDKATKANVERAFADMAQKVKPTDRFILFMMGHATRSGGGLKFNLPGPDVSEAEYADFINRIPAQQMILVFGFPYSASMVPPVSKDGRVIITSCSPREGYMRSGFGNIFVDAFSDAAADTDGDGAISLLEAFLYTQKKVKEWYEKDGSVASEHPHLDDNGDGIPSRKDLPPPAGGTLETPVGGVPDGKEGTLAGRTFLGKRRSPLIAAAQPPQSTIDNRQSTIDNRQSTTVNAESKPANDAPLRYVPDVKLSSQADQRQIKALIANAPDAKKYPDASAIVLWEAEMLDINEDVSYVYSTRRVVKFFNEKGRKFGEISIPYTRGSDDITIHHARTITPDGRTVELDLNQIVKDIPPPSAVQAGLFVDARLMHFTMPQMSDGCIIDYAYSSNNRGHLMRGEFWRQVYFQTSEPIHSYRFTVQTPKKKELYYQIHGPQIKPAIAETNYTRTYTFEVRDVPALREEAFMPPVEDLAYSISISSLDSWEKLIEWYATLIREQDHITPEIESKTKALLMGAWSRKEKIKRIYEYVATNINYVGIELGIWAIKPHAAFQIFKEGYGDCKDKATLLSTMLAAAGIKSYPVLISAGESSNVVREIPSLAYFNHMILVAEENDDGGLIWLDATAETCAYGDLPASDQDRWGLIINPDFLTKDISPPLEGPGVGSSKSAGTRKNNDASKGMQVRLYQFAKSPTLPADQNLKRVVTQIQVENDLSVKVNQVITVTGEFNTKLRSHLKYISPDDRAKFLQEYMELDDRAKLDKFEISGLETLGKELKLTFTWHCTDYLFAIGHQFVLELPIVKHPYAALLSEESRTHPVVLGKALALEDEITVNLGDRFTVDSVPENREVNTSVGAIQINYTQSKRRMTMKQTLRFQTPTVEGNGVTALKELVRVAANKGTKRVMLIQQ